MENRERITHSDDFSIQFRSYLQNRFPQILSFKDAHKPLSGIVDAFSHIHLNLDAAVGNPLPDVLLMLLPVGRAGDFVKGNKALKLDPPEDQLEKTADRV